jgi:IPT/TIG domain
MAQNALTVTPPNPTPPTNMSFLGTTPPTAPAQPTADDGTAQTLVAFAAKTASVDNALFPSVEHEGRGTEVVVTQTYPAGVVNPNGPLQMFSCLGAYTTTPNAQHASSLSPATNPAITSLTPASTASGTGTVALTVTGTNFTRQSVVYVNGVAQTTVYVSPTSLTVAAAPKKATAGTLPVTVVTGGVVTTAPTNWTFT